MKGYDEGNVFCHGLLHGSEGAAAGATVRSGVPHDSGEVTFGKKLEDVI
jgi:hypothetical protein